MPQKHTHCYSNYVNHILNNSPSKITYTFPKKQRFSPSINERKAPVDEVIQKMYQSSNKKLSQQVPKQILTANKKFINNFVSTQKQPLLRYPLTANPSSRKQQISRTHLMGQNKEIFPFEKYLNTEVVKGQSDRKKMQRSKSSKAVRFEKDLNSTVPLFSNFSNKSKTPDKNRKVWVKDSSPIKSERKKMVTQVQAPAIPQNRNKGTLGFSNYSPDKNLSNNKYLKYSPYYRQYLENNGEQNELSREKCSNLKGLDSKSRDKKKHSRIRTATIALQQIDHPSKHITIQGYYPLGVQLNPNGKYIPSTYKNTPAHSFGKSPVKNEKLNKSHSSKRFTLTPDKNKTLLPNGAQLYPEGNSYYRNLTDKKSGRQTKLTEEKFIPFSQFGNLNAFRY